MIVLKVRNKEFLALKGENTKALNIFSFDLENLRWHHIHVFDVKSCLYNNFIPNLG